MHGCEELRAEQWFDLMIDDVLAGFGMHLAPEVVRSELFELSGFSTESFS